MHACGLLPTARRPQGHPVLGCRRCGGVWIDTETLEAIMRAADDDAPPSGMGGGVRRRRMARGSMSAPIRYRKCIACGHRMLRRNFARISGVVVDQCRRHGTYFDAGELEDVLAFIRSGGLEAARRTDDAERARDLRRARPVARSDDADSWGAGPRADLGSAFLRWAGRWLEGS